MMIGPIGRIPKLGDIVITYVNYSPCETYSSDPLSGGDAVSPDEIDSVMSDICDRIAGQEHLFYHEENDQCEIEVAFADEDWETSEHTDFGREETALDVGLDYVVLVGRKGLTIDDFEERMYWKRIDNARELEEKGETYRAARMYERAGHARIGRDVRARLWKTGLSLDDLREGIAGYKLLTLAEKPDDSLMILYPEHEPVPVPEAPVR